MEISYKGVLYTLVALAVLAFLVKSLSGHAKRGLPSDNGGFRLRKKRRRDDDEKPVNI